MDKYFYMSVCLSKLIKMQKQYANIQLSIFLSRDVSHIHIYQFIVCSEHYLFWI